MKKIFAVLALVVVVLPSLGSAQTATDVACTGCVNATDLATNAVTSTKILVSAVTSAKIADGTIVNADISSTAAISASKISGTAWTGTNDGSGSTLDADYLDSFTSSQFLRSDTSGTLTGNLTLTNPSAGSELRVDGNAGTYGLYLGADSNFPYIGSRTDSDLRLVTNSVEKVRITSGGNVGIGTTSPNATLDVRGSLEVADAIQVGDSMVFPSPDIADHGDSTIEGSVAWYVVQFGSSGGTIYLQPGTYTVVSQAIPLADHIAIIGSGPSSIIEADASLQDDVINNESVSSGAAGVSDVTLRDFQVVGNHYTNWVAGDTTGGDYQDCIDIGGSTTEADYNTNITLSGLILSDCGRHGIVLKHTQELAMSDLFLHDNGTGVYHHNIYLADVNNAMLSNIESEGAAGSGIKIKHTSHATLSNIIAHGNVEYGIRVDADSNNVTISSSSAYSNGLSGFMFTTDDGSSAHDITLNGCATYENTWYGVEVNDANNVVISGCTIRGNNIDGIHLENADRVAITGNMIYSNTTYGVSIDSASSDSLLVGNVNTGNGTDVGGTGSFSVKDNNL